MACDYYCKENLAELKKKKKHDFHLEWSGVKLKVPVCSVFLVKNLKKHCVTIVILSDCMCCELQKLCKAFLHVHIVLCRHVSPPLCA